MRSAGALLTSTSNVACSMDGEVQLTFGDRTAVKFYALREVAAAAEAAAAAAVFASFDHLCCCAPGGGGGAQH